MDNSRSLEALYQDGTGMVSLPKKSYKASIEGYDGFDDVLSIDLAKSEENLAFLDTFQMIEAKNAADKIKMCKKLSANYGTRSGIPTAAATSVESLCHMMSLEEAAKAEAAGVNTGNEEVANKPEPKTKKVGFFRTIFNAISDFFKFIAKLFRKFVGLFQKKVVEEEKGPDATVDMNVNADKSESSSASSSTNVASLNLKKLNGKPLDIRGLKVEKISTLANNYKNLADRSKQLADIATNLHANNGDDAAYDKKATEIRTSNANIMKQIGFNVSTSDFNVDTKKATTFDKFYKMAEKQISSSDDETYATVLKNLCNISTIDEKQWTALAANKEMKCDESQCNQLKKAAEIFATAADEYSSIASELANKVDASLSNRTRKTTEEGTDGKIYEGRKWSNDNGQMTSLEVKISSTAAMLKFSSKVGKLIMDIFNRIVSTQAAASKVRNSMSAAKEAANKAARDATKTAKNV